MPTAPSRPATEEEDDALTPLPPAVGVQPRSKRPPAPAVQAPAPAPAAPVVNPALGSMDAPDLSTRAAATKLQLGQRVTGSELGRIAERQRLEAGGATTQGGPGMDAPDRAVRIASLKAQTGIPLSDKEVRRVAERQRLEQAAGGLSQDRSITPLLAGSRLDPRGTFAQQQAQARRDEIARRREEIAAQNEAQKSRNAALEAQMRGTGQKFYTDPFGDIQPILESGTGRALYAETPWEDGGKHPKTGEPTLVKRDRYGQRQFKSPQLVASPDLSDTQLYYKFGEDDLRPAGEIAAFKTHANPNVARLAKKADATRRQAAWKEAILPMEAAKAAIESEYDAARQRQGMIQGELDAAYAKLAEVPEELASQTEGGVFGIGARPTPAAVQAQQLRAQIQQQIAALTNEQAQLSEDLKPLGALGRRQDKARLDLKIFKAKSQYEAYADLADERREILRAQGKSEEGDPTLKSILQAQRAFSSAIEDSSREAARRDQIAAQVTPPPAAAEPEVGTLGGIVRSGQRAALQSGAAFNVLGAQNRLAKRDQYLTDVARLEEQAANIDTLQPQWSPERRAAFAQRALRSAETLRQRAAQMGESAGGEMATAADRLKRSAEITGSAIYEGYQGAKGWDAVARFLADPVEISSNIAVEGGLGSLPALGMGVAGAATAGLPGAAAGAGLGSFATEYASALTQTMAEMGVDVTNPQQISQAFADPEVMDAARQRGFARGIPVGIFDAISGGIAGRAVAPAVRGGVGAALRAGGTELAQQAGLGMAGEAAGQVSEQVAATGGVQGLNLGDIAAEGIGGIVPGIGQIGIGTALRANQAAQGGTPPAAPQAPVPIEPAPAPTPRAELPTEPAQAEAEFQRRISEDRAAVPAAPGEAPTAPAEVALAGEVQPQAPGEVPTEETALVTPDRRAQLRREVANLEESAARGTVPEWYNPDTSDESIARLYDPSGERLGPDDIAPQIAQMRSDPRGIRAAMWDLAKNAQLQGRRDLLNESSTPAPEPTPAPQPAPAPEPPAPVAAPESPMVAAEAGEPAAAQERVAPRPLPANARITIQEPAIPGEPRSGYQQIDLIREDGESEGSFSPETLRQQGYDIPDLSTLTTGQYNADLSPFQPTAQNALQIQSPGTLPLREAPGGGEGVRRENQVDQEAAGARQVPGEGGVQGGEVAVAGAPISREWTAFAPDSGTLGIPRAEMPQVKSEARGALVNFLRARDIPAKAGLIRPNALKPTQAEFSPEKVQAAREHKGSDRPILISSDNHVVDGHHQWVAALDDPETPMPVIRLNAPIDKVLAEMKEFPSTESAPGATAAKTAQAEPSVSAPATKLLSDRAIAALQKAKINKPGSGRVLSADPFTLAYDGAIDLAILGLRAGRPVEQVVRMAIDRFKAKHAKHTPEDLAKLETDIWAALTQEAAPKAAPTKQQPSRLPESLKAAGVPTETINYEARNQEERRREAAAIIAKEGREKAEAELSNPEVRGDTRVAIGGQLLNERMLALREAKPEEVAQITRDIRRITAKMQPELATEAGQTISMIGGILKDIRVAAALDYVKTVNAKRVQKMGGAEAEAAAQDAADAFNAAKTDAEKAAAIKRLKDRYTTKPVRKMLEGLEGVEKIKELNKLGVLTRDDMIDVAGNALGLPGASPQKLRRIAELSDRIENAKNHSERSKAELELAETMQSYKGVSALDLESSMLTASILSGPTTQFANLQGNALNTLVQLATTAAVNPTRLGQIARGTIEGIPLGFQQAASIMRTGRGTRDFQDFAGGRGQINPLQTVDYARDFGVPTPAAKVLNARARALEKVFRFMKAVDSTFYYPAREAYARLAADKLLDGAYSGAERNRKISEMLHTTPESFDSATKQATEEGYEGIDRARRVADIIEERRASTPDGATATKQAEQFAAETTYTNEPVGVAGAFYRNLSKLVGEVPALKPWLMFLKTPANVFNAATNFTPIGAARAQFGMMGEKFRKGGTGEGQWRNFNKDERARLYLQSLVGTAMMGGIIFQVLDKKEIDLTGKGPSDAGKRRQLMQGGWRPYSIKVGDRWYSYRDSPLLIPLSIAGNFTDAVKYEGAKKNQDLDKKAALAMARFPETIFQTSMLTGIADLMSALSGKGGGPEGITRTLGSLPANMAIPYNRMLQQIDQSFDEQTYDSPAVIGSVPFARRMGTPQTDVQGRPQKYDPWGRFSSRDTGDAVDAFIREKNVFIPEVGKDVKLGKETMTDEQRDAFRRISGQRIRIRLQPLIPRLRAMTPEKAQDEVDRIAREERDRVKPLIRAGVGVKK